ncbi:glycosyltransferase family 2 protein [Crocosphaera chwakensis]|uniref:Glycosyltransferase involved in cell wall biogenesis n=1 Tax=Crocosphaera chwakensis CCY0110 TaxID=391612 RepID=A3ILZ9_9CHRO|nr:glycosyltransferase family 2 protein [Crocosphaera chwakensis]EAZ92455.1 glycosyltransferase involved in cell wall biogenesis [Crocosphaera chwakensis CCY0110]
MISVITPVYKGEAFIESCIKVVIEQNCSDVEHIIVDGGSQDKTVDIIKQYAEKYPHLRWISEADQGQSDAMNKGINLAKGDILAILNVDDYYQPNTLNRVLDIFKTLPKNSFLVGNCKVWDEQGKVKFINKPQKLKLTELLLGWSINPHPINPSAYFYHKSLHNEIGLYDVEDHYTMDVDFLLRVVQKAKVHYQDELWGNYRDIEGTKTFNDRESGQGEKRMKNLFDQYYQQLSSRDKLQVKIKRYWLQKIWSKIQYFERHPDEILLVIEKKTNIFTKPK